MNFAYAAWYVRDAWVRGFRAARAWLGFAPRKKPKRRKSRKR